MKEASPRHAAWHSLVEQHMAGRRLHLARQLLDSHAPAALPAFLFKWDQALAACELMYPPVSASFTGRRLPAVPVAENSKPENDRYYRLYAGQISMCLRVVPVRLAWSKCTVTHMPVSCFDLTDLLHPAKSASRMHSCHLNNASAWL